ncbi:MAG: hypothetical protein M3295_02465, partial [Chloroflexota bacterium]|nr:hypothetical protein [Chloroflexota bacterium]
GGRGRGPIGVLSEIAERVGGAVSEGIGIATDEGERAATNGNGAVHVPAAKAGARQPEGRRR